LLVQTDLGSTGLVFSSPTNFYNLVQGTTIDNDPIPDTVAGDELKFMRQIATASVAYSDIVKKKWDASAKNPTLYPTPNPANGSTTNLSNSLKIIAELIGGGLQTPVYLTSIGGFDTHANQVVANATGTGSHANLLKAVSDSVSYFQKDIEKRGLGDKVVVMTFSEFGRRVTQNGTMGTDHGSAAPLFVIGKGVRGGVLGKTPNLNDLDNNGDIKFEYDFRQIYTSVLQDHLGVDTQLTRNLMGDKDFTTLPIFKTTSSPLLSQNPDFTLEQNFPNPFTDITRIKYSLNKQMYMKLSLYDMMGKEMGVLREGTVSAGNYMIPLNGTNWMPGYYFCAMQCDAGNKVIRLVKV